MAADEPEAEGAPPPVSEPDRAVTPSLRRSPPVPLQTCGLSVAIGPRLMGVARLVLLVIVILVAYLAFHTRGG